MVAIRSLSLRRPLALALLGAGLAAGLPATAALAQNHAPIPVWQGAESRPAILVRGLSLPQVDASASELVRPAELDLYR